MRIALASPPVPQSLDSGLVVFEELVKLASESKAEIICFPESYLPGYPGMGYSDQDRGAESLSGALDRAAEVAKSYNIAIIVPMDWHSSAGLVNTAFVISSKGEILGHQTKNQLDPSEDNMWVSGTQRHLFEVNGVKFGISICHEGFRYPESVRWAAKNGASIVFHPHYTENRENGKISAEWGSMDNPYYEKAMMMRSIENTIYFASVNYASEYMESATSIIDPEGKCIAYQDYGKSGVLIKDIDIDRATGFLAKRFKSELYQK
ncbi:carbon-nitrogen hydrolase family protein [Pedobacter frigoris]|uniref:carbon-nitrogen hydrolase family protein n=1 Tax=Pedobacter frigoris TaxID=2571272 RepID=UPI00292D48F5|nr:carbon-nitrogen hydrolase family protein [Pedobacter frigoris]